MDTPTLLFALTFALIGAFALLLIYMAARAGAADGARDYAEETDKRNPK